MVFLSDDASTSWFEKFSDSLILEFIVVTWNDSVALKSDYEMFTSLKSVWKLGDLWEISTLKSKSIVTLSN